MDPAQPTLTYQRSTEDSDLESGSQEKPPQGPPAISGDEATKVVVTRYLKMLLHEPHNIFSMLACVFMWVLLAGFLILPTSFPEIQKITHNSSDINKALMYTRHLGLLAIGIIPCVVGTLGLLWLGWRHRRNCIWLLSNIFIPGTFNGLSGLIATFVNIYGSDKGVHYDTTTLATLAVTGGCAVVCGFLTLVYTVLKILAIRHHKRQNSIGSDAGDSEK